MVVLPSNRKRFITLKSGVVPKAFANGSEVSFYADRSRSGLLKYSRGFLNISFP